MNLRCTIGEEEKAHHDHCWKNTDGAKYGLGWCRTRGLLREVYGLNGRIQQGESVVLTLLSFGTFRIHGWRSW